jgi:hypothetical protein
VTHWPGGNGDGTRWPGRRPPERVDPPGWFRVFVLDDWSKPDDDKVRHPGGALMGADEVARRRWMEACRQWAHNSGMNLADWLQERRQARLRTMGWDDR